MGALSGSCAAGKILGQVHRGPGFGHLSPKLQQPRLGDVGEREPRILVAGLAQTSFARGLGSERVVDSTGIQLGSASRRRGQ